jgi:hypothetical protein
LEKCTAKTWRAAYLNLAKINLVAARSAASEQASARCAYISARPKLAASQKVDGRNPFLHTNRLFHSEKRNGRSLEELKIYTRLAAY